MPCRAKLALCVLLIFASLVVGCDSYGDVPSLIISNGTTQLIEGDAIDGKDLIDQFYSTSVPDETDKEPDLTDGDVTSPDDGTVYWVKGGEVWHIKKTCQSLSRSKNILSGSVDDAVAAGKTRVCKKCGG